MKNYYSYYRPILVSKKFSDLNPLDCGWADLCPGCENIMFRNYYIIHYITDGSGTVTWPDGKQTTVGKGEIFIIRPNSRTKYVSSIDNPWKYIWISFNGKLCDNFSDVKERTMRFDKNIFEEIKKCEAFEAFKEEYLTSVLFRICVEIFTEKPKNDFIDIAVNYMDYSYKELTGIRELSDRLSVNRSHLTRSFHNRFGISPQEYLINKRLIEAKKFLAGGLNVSETAFAVGYKDSSVFSRAFKKKYGVSPANVKKNKL